MKKIATLLACRSGSTFAFLFAALLMPGCGTEVGNGKKPTERVTAPIATEKAAAGAATNPDDAAPAADTATGTSTNSPSAPGVSAEDPVIRIFEACASPISEMVASTLADKVGDLPITVTVPATGSWTVTIDSDSYSVQLDATAAHPFGIKSSTVSLGSATCKQTTTESTASGSVRTAEYSDGYKTVWTLDTNSHVKAIVVLNAQGTMIGKWGLQ